MRLQEIDQATQLGVRVLEETGERLLEPRREYPLIVRELSPRLHPRITGGECRALGHDAQLELPLEPPLPRLVPAAVEASAVLLDILPWGLVRRVRGPEGEVEKERPVRTHGLKVADPPHRLLHEVCAHVIPVLRPARRIDMMIVDRQLRIVRSAFQPAKGNCMAITE